MSAVTDRQRAESQYLDIVDFVTQRPDEVLNAHAYMAWEHRNQSVEWGSGTRSAIHAAQDRFEHLALAVTLPQRPGAPRPPSPTRGAACTPRRRPAGSSRAPSSRRCSATCVR